jgi:uncharacterized membrane-anchored protein YjiN (DUF445 family)
MGFDIVSTPTLHAVATEDERRLADDLQKRVDEAVSQAEAHPEVVEAADAQRVAGERLAGFQKAERILNQFARQSREQMAALSQSALEAIVESAASGGKPDFGKLKDLVAVENQSRYANRAIERVVEHLIPLAQVTSLREESQALVAKARALERIAQERAEKVLGRLRDAVTEEVVLPVDMSKGVAGALLAHAGGLKRYARQLSGDADQIERAYTKRREG